MVFSIKPRAWLLRPPSTEIEGVTYIDEFPHLFSPTDMVPRPLAPTPSSPPERPTADPNTRGDFLCAHIIETTASSHHDSFPTWAMINNQAMREQGLPAASTPPVPPSVAAVTGPRPRQARPDTLLREPFSDYNAVTPAPRVKFQPRPSPQFTEPELANHSTYLEGLNATRNLDRAIAAGFKDIIEVLDNSAFVAVSRKGRAKDPSIQSLLATRHHTLSKNPQVVVYSLWYPREQGEWADALSKALLPYPTQADAGSRTGLTWLNARLYDAGLNTLSPDYQLK